MTDERGPAPRWSMPSWRRIADFFFTVAQLERSYESLKTENENLSKRVAALEEKLSDQGGQLKILATFVQGALDKHVAAKAEEAAARYVERLIARRDPSDDDRQGE